MVDNSHWDLKHLRMQLIGKNKSYYNTPFTDKIIEAVKELTQDHGAFKSQSQDLNLVCPMSTSVLHSDSTEYFCQCCHLWPLSLLEQSTTAILTNKKHRRAMCSPLPMLPHVPADIAAGRKRVLYTVSRFFRSSIQSSPVSTIYELFIFTFRNPLEESTVTCLLICQETS